MVKVFIRNVVCFRQLIYYFLFVLFDRSPMEECTGGYYSLGGATKCTYCPAGYQCPTKNVCSFKSYCDYSVIEWKMSERNKKIRMNRIAFREHLQ